jgi:FAD synthetase
MSSVRIIIIGDEILSGKFADENTPWLIQECNKHHLQITGIAIIPDEIHTIASHVRDAAQNATYVITTGGIGPTHDDRTMKGIAMAFDTELTESPELAHLIKKKVGEHPAALRMALVPKNYSLWDCGENRFPQLVVENVFVFPGVPKFLKIKFQAIVGRWKGKRKIRVQIPLLVRESTIAIKLEEIQNGNVSVEIGSYPRFEETPMHTIITVDGFNEESVRNVEGLLRSEFKEWLFPSDQ